MLKEFKDINELQELINKEGKESELIEWKDYQNANYEDKKEEILKLICGFTNNKGGTFIIGVDDKTRKIIHTDIEIHPFQDKLTNWIRDKIEPKGLIVQIKLLEEMERRCIILYVDTTPTICYAQRKGKGFVFPYRLSGSTIDLPYGDFIKIYTSKFLQDIATLGRFYREKEQPDSFGPSIGISTSGSGDGPFDYELVKFHIDSLRKNHFSPMIYGDILYKIRNELDKIRDESEVDENILHVISELLDLFIELINREENQDLSDTAVNMISLLMKNNKLSELVKEKCYDPIKRLYDQGIKKDISISILDKYGYFGITLDQRMETIFKALQNRDRNLLAFQMTKLKSDIEMKKKRFKFLPKLYSAYQELNDQKDSEIVPYLKKLIRNFES